MQCCTNMLASFVQAHIKANMRLNVTDPMRQQWVCTPFCSRASDEGVFSNSADFAKTALGPKWSHACECLPHNGTHCAPSKMAGATNTS